jgi:hypothetical protein
MPSPENARRLQIRPNSTAERKIFSWALSRLKWISRRRVTGAGKRKPISAGVKRSAGWLVGKAQATVTQPIIMTSMPTDEPISKGSNCATAAEGRDAPGKPPRVVRGCMAAAATLNRRKTK